MSEFMSVYNLRNLVKKTTCFKNPESPLCIDLILTNPPRNFYNGSVFQMGLPDFRKLQLQS